MKSGFLRSFLQPGILQRLPPGMVEDAAAKVVRYEKNGGVFAFVEEG